MNPDTQAYNYTYVIAKVASRVDKPLVIAFVRVPREGGHYNPKNRYSNNEGHIHSEYQKVKLSHSFSTQLATDFSLTHT